jgi:hypothetical protein
MNTLNESHIGKMVQIKDNRFNSISAGIYVGTKPSEWDGELCCYFKDGHINGVPQSLFGFPIAHFADHRVVLA